MVLSRLGIIIHLSPLVCLSHLHSALELNPKKKNVSDIPSMVSGSIQWIHWENLLPKMFLLHLFEKTLIFFLGHPRALAVVELCSGHLWSSETTPNTTMLRCLVPEICDHGHCGHKWNTGQSYVFDGEKLFVMVQNRYSIKRFMKTQ